MENQDSKITDTLPFKKEEYVKDVEEYMKSPTEDLFYKLRKYRKQCIEYLKKHPDDFDMQVNLIDLNYLGISKSKPPVQKVQEDKTSKHARCHRGLLGRGRLLLIIHPCYEMH